MASTSHRERVTVWRKPLLAAHLAFSMSLIGAALVLVELGISGMGGPDPPRSVYPAAQMVGSWVVAPLAAAVLAAGAIQAIPTGLGLVRYR